jgi:hypothetical protein
MYWRGRRAAAPCRCRGPAGGSLRAPPAARAHAPQFVEVAFKKVPRGQKLHAGGMNVGLAHAVQEVGEPELRAGAGAGQGGARRGDFEAGSACPATGPRASAALAQPGRRGQGSAAGKPWAHHVLQTVVSHASEKAGSARVARVQVVGDRRAGG